jgi:endonuclease-3
MGPGSSIGTENHTSKHPRAVTEVCRTLESVYGRPRLGNPRDPIDDLVFIVMSNKTAAPMARRTYRRLKEVYREWDQVLLTPLKMLRSILKPAGLSRVKSRQLQQALRRIRRDFGACELGGLKGQPETLVHEYLTSLPGVSDKVAKCVMMYTMGAQVLPVDAHVHRIATRLGWTTRKRADQCHEVLESLVPPQWRYSFHVGCVLHGRNTCHPYAPNCRNCCINRLCDYFQNSKKDV